MSPVWLLQVMGGKVGLLLCVVVDMKSHATFRQTFAIKQLPPAATVRTQSGWPAWTMVTSCSWLPEDYQHVECHLPPAVYA